MKNFNELDLPQSLKKALEAMGFQQPTPIQAQSIPVILSQKDIIGCAQTGTGKTAAFGVPTVAHLLKATQQKALVLVPTRELAAQVSQVIHDLVRFSPTLQATLLIGGAPMHKQKMSLKRNPRVIIATPGRLLDHLRQRNLSLDQVSMLILDEADRMLDMGFAPQLNEILRYLPKKRQTLMFSATLPKPILQLAKKYLQDPVHIVAGNPAQAKVEIDQKVLEVEPQNKKEALLDALNERHGSVLVFAQTQRRTDQLSYFLESYNVSVARIHGGRSQGQRNRALEGFRTGKVRVLVATDIAARGIDIDHVAHVINYDLPQVPEDYVHRIGRTGRAGRTGEALSFVSRQDRSTWKAIRRLFSEEKNRQQTLQ